MIKDRVNGSSAFLPIYFKRRYEHSTRKMNQPDKHIPSQALAALLRKRLPAAEVQRIEELYHWAAEHGALVETGTKRGEGVSFNPRPARICQLLIVEGSRSQSRVLEAALLATAANEIDPPAEFKEAAQIAIKVGEAGPDSTDLDAFAISLCIALDSVRHLHMGADSLQRTATLEHASALLSNSIACEKEPRLAQLLRGAIALQERLVEAQ